MAHSARERSSAFRTRIPLAIVVWSLLLSGGGVCAGGEGDAALLGVRRVSVGLPQSWIVAEDLNADGRQDLIVVTDSESEVTILLGGPAGFSRSFLPGSFRDALHAAVGRLDSDAHPDLVVATRDGANVYLGNGDGTFRAEPEDRPVLPSRFFGRQVVIADPNRDGHADILLGDEQAGVVRVFLGDGSGVYAPTALDAALRAEPHFFCVADLTGEGNLDLVFVAGTDNILGVALGNGDGTFEDPVTLDVGDESRFVAAANVVGDANIDVVITNRAASTVTLLAGRGDGTLGDPETIDTAASPEFLTVADIDGDGQSDLLVLGGDDEEGLLAVHRGVAGGTFEAPRIAKVGRLPVGLALPDLDGDGYRDAVIANRGSTRASWVRGSPTGLLLPRRIDLSGEPVGVTAVDLDGASGIDLVTTLRNQGGFTWILADGDGGFQAPVEYVDPTFLTDLIPIDYNRDGKVDLAGTNALEGLTIWPGRGDGGLDGPIGKPAGLLPSAVVWTDLDADRVPDVCVANRGSDDVTFYPGLPGGGLGPSEAFPVGDEPVALAAGDLNDDDIADVVTANAADGEVSILISEGVAGFLPDIRFAAGVEPVAVAIGDVDGDGEQDLAVADRGGDALQLLLGEGGGFFADPVTVPSGDAPIVVWLGDLDGDDDLDAAVLCADDGALFIHHNDDGAFSRISEYETGRSSADMVVADVDGDGLLDFVTADAASGHLTILAGMPPTSPPAARFRRGHTNDDGRLDLSDAVALLNHLFLGGTIVPCPDAADSNDDGRVDLSDAVFTLGYLFLGKDAIPLPGADTCGIDPTEDGLDPCEIPCS